MSARTPLPVKEEEKDNIYENSCSNSAEDLGHHIPKKPKKAESSHYSMHSSHNQDCGGDFMVDYNPSVPKHQRKQWSTLP